MAPLYDHAELKSLADDLYKDCEDDDAGLGQDVAIQLCTSDLTNAAQTYIYAFNEVPDIDVYDILLLEPSSRLLHGIKNCRLNLQN